MRKLVGVGKSDVRSGALIVRVGRKGKISALSRILPSELI